jgi:dipeptidyl aminopeptidase/acylaminoacyl peptidase
MGKTILSISKSCDGTSGRLPAPFSADAIGGSVLSVTKKFLWKTAAAGVVVAGVILAAYAVVNWLNRETGMTPAKHGPVTPAAVPKRGIILFQSRVGGLWQIFSLDLSSGARTRLTRSKVDDIHPSVSPDGSWIAFESARSGRTAVWRMRADGSGVERLTDGRRDCLDPSWGSGGTSILYSCPKAGEIFIMELSTRLERQLTDSIWPSILPVASPDGSAIAFTRNKFGWGVYRMNADGSGVTALTSKGGSCRPDWSPDGKRIAFVSSRADGKGDVWTMDPDGGNMVRVTLGDDSYDYNPAWSPDGRWIVYETTKGSKRGPWSLAVIPAGGGGIPALLTPPGADDRFPDWAPGKGVQ